MPRTGVLLLGFGGPDSIEAVEPFMCNLMGRPPASELLERICGNYEAIGGRSPLADIAQDIADSLSARFRVLGRDVPVRVGMRYWHPYIADSLRELAEDGCSRVVAVSLSPFESKVASEQYRLAIDEARESTGAIEVVEAPLLSEMSAFADFLAEATLNSLSGLAQEAGALVAFTAHSLPVGDLVDGDPYVGGLRRTASEIAERLGWHVGTENADESLAPAFSAFGTIAPPQPWVLVYQSKGARPGAWLEPTLQDLIAASKRGGFTSLVVCPIGFMTDHMETLFDLDKVAAAQASDEGLAFVRAPVPNDDERVVDALAREVERLL